MFLTLFINTRNDVDIPCGHVLDMFLIEFSVIYKVVGNVDIKSLRREEQNKFRRKAASRGN